MLIAIADIRIGDRLRRNARPDQVVALADSIRQIGLQHPISVRERSVSQDNSATLGVGYELVAGLHRLEAHKTLSLVEIEATVVTLGEAERQLWEIDENLCRADLTELEQGEHLLRRKEIYEWWRPETRQHIAGGLARQGTASDKLSFAADTATKTGIDPRTVQRSIKRATKIDPKVRDRIRDNPDIADSGVELDALATLDPQQQRKAVALVEAGQAGGIRDAKKLMEPKPQKITPNFKAAAEAEEKQFQALVKAWNAAGQLARDRFDEWRDKPVADNTSPLRVVS